MASRYDSFEAFMVDVVCTAEEVHSLDPLFDVRNAEVVKYCKLLIENGWLIFLAVVALIVLGPLAFAGALFAFVVTPIGLAVAAIFGIGAATVVKILYNNKDLPLAIKLVGNRFKPQWQATSGHAQVDRLVVQAACALFQESNHSLPSRVSEYIQRNR